MCGITGIYAFNEVGRMHLMHLQKSTDSLTHRGPNDQGTFVDYFVGLGHRRLSIIDTSDLGHQPMQSWNRKYIIVFNGEIYNYIELRNELISAGVKFSSHTDTEVLLNAYIKYGKDVLNRLNGFFSFAIYNKEDRSLFIARDRLGIKPLYVFQDDDKLIFSSEVRAVLEYGVARQIDRTALKLYFEFNYIPHPKTILEGIRKLEPGTSLVVSGNGIIEKDSFYKLRVHRNPAYQFQNYEEAKNGLKGTLENSVEQRLVSDVPLGTFLSGGIDSSIISCIAASHIERIDTFSIGFKDEPYYDETQYAELVAKKIGSYHHTFRLSNEDLFNDLDRILESIDEPFADSSSILVNILSNRVAKNVTVALSGDGADELFSGYNKHEAWIRSLQTDWQNSLLRKSKPIFNALPKSRAGKVGDIFRKLGKYSLGLNLDPVERYWAWAQFTPKSVIDNLFTSEFQFSTEEYNRLRSSYLEKISDYQDFNDFLLTDVNLVLTNDMLTKVDMMSMANALEVRVPFLDHRVVEFAFSIPPEFKIDGSLRKRILKDSFRHMLPEEIFQRGKHGFEVPLLKWFRNELRSELENYVFNQHRIEDQGIFNFATITQIKKMLYSNSPQDSHWMVWALYVFQKYYERHLS